MLKELRAVNGFLKQIDFATAIGENQSTVASWESGKSKPSIKKVVKIAKVLNVPIEKVIECFNNEA